ncbi:hypothetical protein D3C75_783220 [compost metagenome]
MPDFPLCKINYWNSNIMFKFCLVDKNSFGLAVFKHECNSVFRVGWIYRYIRPSRFQNRVNPYNHLDTPLCHNGYEVVRLYTHFAQFSCQLIGSLIHLCVRNLLTFEYYCYIIGCFLYLLLE